MLKKLNRRSVSQNSAIEQPTDLSTSASDQPALPDGNAKNRSRRIRFSKVSGARLLSIPDMPKPTAKSVMGIPDVTNFHVGQDGNTPKEMVPVLTFLAAHGNRPYMDGYFMVLNELNNNGEPIKDRKWHEVFASLHGTVITMWDAALLDQGIHEMSFINVTDCYMRSVESLGPDLQNVIVMSTTMKNRYIFQFGTKTVFNEWSATLRLAAFERTSLQEAYTGALLSSKGSQMNGIRSVLSESKHPREFSCDVRFGVGMPWKRVWVVVTPNAAIKDKKLRKRKGHLGQVEFYSDQKSKGKKRPLVVIHQAFSAFAVFPEKAVLADVSTLIKMECLVEFEGDVDIRESSVFMMPESNSHYQGFETLISVLIPLYDVFGLYGRPKRLNADKSDLNSLLFGLPSLPRVYYMDVVDVYMLASLPESQTWSNYDWNMRIKELLARKLAAGFRGTGNVHQTSASIDSNDRSSRDSSVASNLVAPSNLQEKPRAVSEPRDIRPFLSNSRESTSTGSNDALGSGTQSNKPSYVHSRPAPRAPGNTGPQPSNSAAFNQNLGGDSVPKKTDYVQSNTPEPVAVPVPYGNAYSNSNHKKTKSTNNTYENGLLSPELGDTSFDNPSKKLDDPNAAFNRTSAYSTGSVDSFSSATDNFGRNEPIPTASSAAPVIPDSSNDQKVDNSKFFDPAYRPSHMSYADYSEYMRHYLQNLSTSKSTPIQEDEANTELNSASTSNRNGGGQPTSARPPQMQYGVAHGSSEGSARPSTPPSSNARAQLLNTPVRTPAISLNTHSPNEAKTEEDSPQTTTLSAPRIGAYPNAPGSPAYKNSPESRKPVGPRPTPQGNWSNSSLGSSANTQTGQALSGSSGTGAPHQNVPYKQTSTSAQMPPGNVTSGQSSSSYAPAHTPNAPGYASPGVQSKTGNPYTPQNSNAMRGANPYQTAQVNPPTGPVSGPGGPSGPRPLHAPTQGPKQPMHQQQGFAPGYAPGYPQAYPQAYPQGYPQMYPQNYPQGYMQPQNYYAGPMGGGVPANAPRPMQQANPYTPAQSGYGLRSNSMTPQGALGNNPVGNKSPNEVKAQQLRSVRAQALDGKNFGI